MTVENSMGMPTNFNDVEEALTSFWNIFEYFSSSFVDTKTTTNNEFNEMLNEKDSSIQKIEDAR